MPQGSGLRSSDLKNPDEKKRKGPITNALSKATSIGPDKSYRGIIESAIAKMSSYDKPIVNVGLSDKQMEPMRQEHPYLSKAGDTITGMMSDLTRPSQLALGAATEGVVPILEKTLAGKAAGKGLGMAEGIEDAISPTSEAFNPNTSNFAKRLARETADNDKKLFSSLRDRERFTQEELARATGTKPPRGATAAQVKQIQITDLQDGRRPYGWPNLSGLNEANIGGSQAEEMVDAYHKALKTLGPNAHAKDLEAEMYIEIGNIVAKKEGRIPGPQSRWRAPTRDEQVAAAGRKKLQGSLSKDEMLRLGNYGDPSRIDPRVPMGPAKSGHRSETFGGGSGQLSPETLAIIKAAMEKK